MPVTVPPASVTMSAPAADVPRLEVLFPERLEPTGGHIAEIERRGAEPAHRPRLTEKRAEQAHQIGPCVCTSYGKPVTSSASSSVVGVGDLQRDAIEVGTSAALRGEQFAARRIVDRAHFGWPSISSASDEQKIGSPCA